MSQLYFDLGDGFAAKAATDRSLSAVSKNKSVEENPNWWTSAGLFGNSLAELMGSTGYIGVQEALRQTAVLICVDVLASDIAKATLRLKQKVRDGGVREIEPKQHPLARMLALQPNIRHTWPEFIGMLVYHFALSSNSYVYVRRSNVGDAMELIPVLPGRVTDRVLARTRETFYDINASTEQEIALLGATHVVAPERDVIHIRNRMLDGFYGYSTLVAGVDALKSGKAIGEYSRKLYDKDGMIRGAFVREGKAELSDTAFRRLQEQLKKLMKKVIDENDPILLEDGIKFQEIAMKAQEAEMSKSLQNQIEMICQLFKMPPHKAMHLASVKYENLATMEQQYAKNTLYPICEMIEARLARTLLTEDERLSYFFEFDRDELSMADEEQHREWVKMLVDRSAIDLDEARAEAGYNPMPNKRGKVRYIPANGVLIDENNEVVAAGAAAQGGVGADDDSGGDAAEESGKDKTFKPRIVASR